MGHSAKQAFMEACREEGVTASEVVRHFVETYPNKPEKPGWPVFKPQLPEPAMNLSAVILLSAALGTSAILPATATAHRTDPAEQFAEIDVNGDGFLHRTEFFNFAGLTADGELSAEMRAEVQASMQRSLDDLDMLAQEATLSPAFIERTLEQAQEAAASSVSMVFEDLDDDGDGRVSRAEFITYSDYYQMDGPGLTGPSGADFEPGLTGPER